MKKSILYLILFLALNLPSYAQLSFGISFGGLGYHPVEALTKNADFYKWKIDKKGKWAGYASMTFFLSYRFNEYIGAKIMQTLVFHDCAGKFAGISHIGIDFHDDIIGWKNPENQFSFSFGPFWYYRKNWSKEAGYQNDPNFIKLNKNKTWERKFVWHGGQIEYANYYHEDDAFTINILPGYPYLYTFGIGFKKDRNIQ